MKLLIWAEKWKTKQRQIELKEKRIKEIEKEIDNTVTKLTNTTSDIVYKVLEEKITKLDEERKLLQAEILSVQGWTMDNYMTEFDWLKTIIQCPYNVWRNADLELKRLLISNIFNNTLSYSKEKWLRTKEIPLIYAKNPGIASKINLNKKSPLRTTNSLVETLSYSNSDQMVEVRRVELRSKRHAYKFLPL